MRPQNTQNSGRRSGRGPRRQYRSSSQSNGAPKAPVPKTFWQKITAFFTGGDTAPAPRAPIQNGSPRRAESPRPGSRKPELLEVSSPKLYVGNLSYDATESDLFELFSGVGKVANAEIVSHKYNQKSKGFAFVMMQSIEEAQRAVTELHDKDFMGRKLVVSGAKTSDVPSRGSGEEDDRRDTR